MTSATAELFKDGLLDITFGFGFMEKLDASGWDAHGRRSRAVASVTTPRDEHPTTVLPRLLASCRGALVAAGDQGALRDLVAAYGSPVEGSRRSLLEAMRALGGVNEATRLASSADAADRRLAARLMHLLPDGHHLSSLESLVADPEVPWPPPLAER
jgi:hypothetical protein